MPGSNMNGFNQPNEKEIRKINRVQGDFFSKIVRLFDPPLPEGVPERLEQIVASANIARGDTVLDVGSGTGILLSSIKAYAPAKIIACDLSSAMLDRLKEKYPFAETMLADVRDLRLPDKSLDVVCMNACYSNIVDKEAAFDNISRMMRSGGRLVVSHPMGKSFIDSLKNESPFPLDNFPAKTEANALLEPFGFSILELIDKKNLYILVATKA